MFRETEAAHGEIPNARLLFLIAGDTFENRFQGTGKNPGCGSLA